VGYIGGFGATTLGAAVYVNRTTNMIMFTQAEAFMPGSPARFTYRNFDAVRDRGLELSVDTRLTPAVTVFANYSWQEDPEPTGFSVSELNLPPSHRINAGVGFTGRRYFGSLSGRFVDSAFWQDWDPRYVGATPSYSTVDGGVGVRAADGTMTVAVRARNLFNTGVQEHAFGDLITAPSPEKSSSVLTWPTLPVPRCGAPLSPDAARRDSARLLRRTSPG
jgi:hypothetical protein